jgi:hypothetical protein
MCPVCIATAAWVAAGAGSGGSLGALLLSRIRRPRREIPHQHFAYDRHAAPMTHPGGLRSRVSAAAVSPVA